MYVGTSKTNPRVAAAGERMREIRGEQGRTQEEVAGQVIADGQSMDQPRYSKIERGKKPITMEELVGISQALLPDDDLGPAKLLLDKTSAELVEAHQKQGLLGVSNWLLRMMGIGS